MKMVWRYLECKAYGVAIDTSAVLVAEIQKHASVLSFTEEMSIEGHGSGFVYVTSSYTEIQNIGLTDEFPDIYGDDDHMPQYPVFLVKEHDPVYNLSTLESEALSEVVRGVTKGATNDKMCWVHYAYVYNDEECKVD